MWNSVRIELSSGIFQPKRGERFRSNPKTFASFWLWVYYTFFVFLYQHQYAFAMLAPL